MSPRVRAVSLGLILMTGATAGCGSAEGHSSVPTRQAKQTIVAVDLSGSQTPQTLKESREFLGKIIDNLDYGDQIVLLEMNRTGVRGNLKRFSDSIPALRDPTFASSLDKRRKKGVVDAMLSLLPLIFDSTLVGKIPTTDIVSTLHTASEYAQDANGRKTTVILLSDMLQSTKEIEMERLRRMPPVGWIAQQRANGTLPDLNGVCVAAVGAEATTREGATVKRFWTEYLKAAGADFRPSNYRLLTTQVSGIRCG